MDETLTTPSLPEDPAAIKAEIDEILTEIDARRARIAEHDAAILGSQARIRAILDDIAAQLRAA
jgi:hypothetical protein